MNDHGEVQRIQWRQYEDVSTMCKTFEPDTFHAPPKKPYIRAKYVWTPELIALLGTISDAAMTERIGGKPPR